MYTLALGTVWLSLLSSVTQCIPSLGNSLQVKEEVLPPRGWLDHSAPSPDDKLLMRIALPQPNFHILEQHLYEVSDPDHERYGAHLSKEQVEDLVAPHQESLDAVDAWLLTHGIQEADITRSPAKDWVTLRVPISLAEKMLDTTYRVWKHVDSGDYLTRTTSYKLPSHMHEHIDLIQPTTMFARLKKERSTIASITKLVRPENLQPTDDHNTPGAVDPSCNDTITISCLQQLYGSVGYQPLANISNSIGITGYLEQFANEADLQTFYGLLRPDALGSSFNLVSVKGGLNDQNASLAGDEANLDVQYGFGLSFPIPGTFFSTAGRPPFIPDFSESTDNNEPYTDWLDFVLSHPNPPLTISTSYDDDEQTVPQSFAQRACNGFAQLGARGVSLLFASGDSGVGDGNSDPATQQCFSNDGRNVTKFIPNFPSSCPFVTSVGATAHIPEAASSEFFSGGGFSDIFDQPSYQKVAVDNYLKTLPKGKYQGLFNPAGRAYPDVAAQSQHFLIVIGGEEFIIDGTSAATPAFSGFVSLLNDARLRVGKPSLGFLNPLLYSRGAAALNDITQGNNPGCGTLGFNATKGWDPVTGLGTPNFPKLKALVENV